MKPRNTGNKTKALESYKQRAVSVDFHPLGMIILTASKGAVHILIGAAVAGIVPLPAQRADGEAAPFSEVCGDKEKTCTRHVSGSQPILLPAWEGSQLPCASLQLSYKLLLAPSSYRA